MSDNPRPLRAPRLGRRLGLLSAAATLAGCVFVPPPPLPEELAAEEAKQAARKASRRRGSADPTAAGASGEGPSFTAGEPAPAGLNEVQVAAYAEAQGDPHKGRFKLAEALAGLEGDGDLWVRFVTDRGDIQCRLFEDAVPRTVANFVGLARGVRASRPTGSETWAKIRYYDNTVFHRVIPGFMIQAGDRMGTGLGDPGYVIMDELREHLRHDRAGMLSMANRGPNTGAAQFFVTLAPTPHLDGLHTVFGACDEAGVSVAEGISLAPRGANDKPNEDERLVRVEVFRKAAPANEG